MKVDAVIKGTGVSTVIEERGERERERERERGGLTSYPGRTIANEQTPGNQQELASN